MPDVPLDDRSSWSWIHVALGVSTQTLVIVALVVVAVALYAAAGWFAGRAAVDREQNRPSEPWWRHWFV